MHFEKLDSLLERRHETDERDEGYFNKISNDLDSALSKNAAASKTRPGDLEDAR